ncbi:hypothetical protein AWENTII_000644 [Aspergillus wentii]
MMEQADHFPGQDFATYVPYNSHRRQAYDTTTRLENGLTRIKPCWHGAILERGVFSSFFFLMHLQLAKEPFDTSSPCSFFCFLFLSFSFHLSFSPPIKLFPF